MNIYEKLKKTENCHDIDDIEKKVVEAELKYQKALGAVDRMIERIKAMDEIILVRRKKNV